MAGCSLIKPAHVFCILLQKRIDGVCEKCHNYFEYSLDLLSDLTFGDFCAIMQKNDK